MSKRGDAELTQDIPEAIESYTSGSSYSAFREDLETQDAVIRNLEIIGEATKKLSAAYRKKSKHIPWQDIAGMRDRLIQDYFGVNWEIVWDVIQTKLPELKRAIESAPDKENT